MLSNIHNMLFFSALLLLAAPFSCAQQCPGCGIIPDHQAWCMDGNFTTVPSCLPSDTQTLYLSFNSITSLDSESFRSLPDIEILDVQSNPINTIAPDTFAPIPKLSQLWANDCNLTEIPEDLFSYTPEIVIIILRENSIWALSENTFANNYKLATLDLGENRLLTVPTNIFKPLPLLSELYLDFNQINNLHDDLFVNNSNINILNVNHNNLQRLNEFTFQPLTKLFHLTLYNNSIDDIPSPSTFSKNTILQNLDLAENRLITLNESYFSSNSDMYIWLDGNPWNCDCEIRRLMDALRKQNVGVGVDPTCASPPELAGTLWSALQLNCTTANILFK